jgi:hypothetical protein
MRKNTPSSEVWLVHAVYGHTHRFFGALPDEGEASKAAERLGATGLYEYAEPVPLTVYPDAAAWESSEIDASWFSQEEDDQPDESPNTYPEHHAP